MPIPMVTSVFENSKKYFFAQPPDDVIWQVAKWENKMYLQKIKVHPLLKFTCAKFEPFNTILKYLLKTQLSTKLI